MRYVILTNDNFFSFTVLKDFLEKNKSEIKLIVFSSALIGKRGTVESIKWSLVHTGFRHTIFKLSVYGVFRLLRTLSKIFPCVPNHYSSLLWVQKNQIDYTIEDNINNEQIVEKIRQVSPDLVISVSMNQIVKRELLNIASKGSINVHCAPLPKYAGMSPYVWVLANNEKYSAATIHYMEEGLDEGDIIVQEKVFTKENDSAFSLFYRCCITASKQLTRVVKDFENDKVTSLKQDLSQKTYFSWPDKNCIKKLKSNGYRLATLKDFILAVFKQKSRL